MRSFFYSTVAALLLLLLLYTGLNLVEFNMGELMGLEREAAAFTLRQQANGVMEITFSGATVTLNTLGALNTIKNWLESFSISGRGG